MRIIFVYFLVLLPFLSLSQNIPFNVEIDIGKDLIFQYFNFDVNGGLTHYQNNYRSTNSIKEKHFFVKENKFDQNGFLVKSENYFLTGDAIRHEETTHVFERDNQENVIIEKVFIEPDAFLEINRTELKNGKRIRETKLIAPFDYENEVILYDQPDTLSVTFS